MSSVHPLSMCPTHGTRFESAGHTAIVHAPIVTACRYRHCCVFPTKSVLVNVNVSPLKGGHVTTSRCYYPSSARASNPKSVMVYVKVLPSLSLPTNPASTSDRMDSSTARPLPLVNALRPRDPLTSPAFAIASSSASARPSGSSVWSGGLIA